MTKILHRKNLRILNLKKRELLIKIIKVKKIILYSKVDIYM